MQCNRASNVVVETSFDLSYRFGVEHGTNTVNRTIYTVQSVFHFYSIGNVKKIIFIFCVALNTERDFFFVLLQIMLIELLFL